MRRRLSMLVLAGLAVGSAGAAIGTTTASASPVCEGLSTSGGVVGSHAVGPVCVPYAFVTECTNTTALALGTTVTEYACVPIYAPGR